jgi:hypothetical protein
MKIHAVAPVSASKTADLPDDQEAPDPSAATAVLVTVVVDALTQATTETVSASVAPASGGERGTRTVEVKVEVRHTAASEEPRHPAPTHAAPILRPRSSRRLPRSNRVRVAFAADQRWRAMRAPTMG